MNTKCMQKCLAKIVPFGLGWLVVVFLAAFGSVMKAGGIAALMAKGGLSAVISVISPWVAIFFAVLIVALLARAIWCYTAGGCSA